MQITVNDDLMSQVIAKGHYHNAQEAVIKILSDYLQQQPTKETNITELLAMPKIADVDFEPPRLNSALFVPADLS